MADATGAPVLDWSSNVGLYMIPATILVPFVLGLCVTRIYTQLRRTKSLRLDDYTIIAATVLSVANFFIACAAVAHGWGHKFLTFTPERRVAVLKLQFAVQTTWIFSLCLVRVSVALSLLRFGQDLLWRGVLYFLMGFQVLVSSSYIVIQFGQCRPVSSNWEQVADVSCWPIDPIINYGWAIAGVYVLMDLTLALMPIRLVRTLTRSTSEKILISCLMALGLLAMAMMCVKMTTFTSFGKGDPMQATIRPSMYAKIEEQIGIIAACLPCLKAHAEKLLFRLGIFKEHQLSRPSFVNTLPLGTLQKGQEQDQRSSAEVESPAGKGEVRVDSVSVLPGSSGSKNQNQNQKHGLRMNGWEEV